jgi:hypothetical protein
LDNLNLLKIGILKAHGIAVTKEIVENVVRNPDSQGEGALNPQNSFLKELAATEDSMVKLSGIWAFPWSPLIGKF